MTMRSRRRRRRASRYSEIDRERHRISDRSPDEVREATAFSDLVPSVVKRMGIQEELWKRQVLEEWTDLVGLQVARHARPGPIERMTLTVYVTSSAWLNELSRYGQKQMLEKLQGRFGAKAVRGIRLQLDPDLGR